MFLESRSWQSWLFILFSFTKYLSDSLQACLSFCLLLELVLSRLSLKHVCGAKILLWILRLLEYYCISNSLNVRLLLKLTLFAVRGFSFRQVATATLRFFALETCSSANCSHSFWVLLDDSRDLFILIKKTMSSVDNLLYALQIRLKTSPWWKVSKLLRNWSFFCGKLLLFSVYDALSRSCTRWGTNRDMVNTCVISCTRCGTNRDMVNTYFTNRLPWIILPICILNFVIIINYMYLLYGLCL